MNKELD